MPSPSPIKGEVGRPKKGMGMSTRLNELNKTWHLLPLSPACNPYYKLVLVTRAVAD